MKRPFQAVFISLSLLGLIALDGCAKKVGGKAAVTRQANAKLDALKQLADALGKDPDGVDARGWLETFRATPLDLQSNPKQAEEIRELYTQRIQGKYKGSVAQELHGDMAPFLSGKKAK